MNIYLSEKFPQIIKPEMDGPYKYMWELSFGCMVGRRIDICLTNLGLGTIADREDIWEDMWIIDATKEIIYEGAIIETKRFKYRCSISNSLGRLILDEIGNWLNDFSNYKNIDDEQHDGDISKANYKIISGRLI
jgi:hypothetical protein